MKLGNFQKSLLISSIVCFILVTLVVCIVLYRYNKNIEWPPHIPDCPDWWKSVGKGDKQKCVNVKKLGTCNIKYVNFNNPTFKGSQGNCSKYTWAKNCNVSWDGITYGVPNPCNSS